jgi:hypothetical protein
MRGRRDRSAETIGAGLFRCPPDLAVPFSQSDDLPRSGIRR